MSASSRLIAPNELALDPTLPANLPDGGGSSSQVIPTGLHRSPNLSLIWHRMLPDRKLPVGEETSPFGFDITGITHDDPKKQGKLRGKAEEYWGGLGVLSWFGECAKKSCGSGFFASGGAYELARTRRENAIRSLGTHAEFVAEAQSPCAIGLGNVAPVENSGLSLDPTYGVPVIPGSSLKGLTRHYVEEEYIPEVMALPVFSALAEGHHRRLPIEEAVVGLLFGSKPSAAEPQADGGAAERDGGAEGLIAFYDAWAAPTTRGWFEPDILNVHHKKYYGHTGESPPEPNDREDPTPVYFLTVRPKVAFGVFLGLTSAGRGLPAECQVFLLSFTAARLSEALQRWGIGAKSGAGYGVMTSGPRSNQS